MKRILQQTPAILGLIVADIILWIWCLAISIQLSSVSNNIKVGILPVAVDEIGRLNAEMEELRNELEEIRNAGK